MLFLYPSVYIFYTEFYDYDQFHVFTIFSKMYFALLWKIADSIESLLWNLAYSRIFLLI